MTRQDASGTRSCSRPSRSGFVSGSGGAANDILEHLQLFFGKRCQEFSHRPALREMRPHEKAGDEDDEDAEYDGFDHECPSMIHPVPRAILRRRSDPMWQYTPRVAVIRGLRTPFAKSGTHYARLSALDLGKIVVAELVERSGINPNDVQELVYGNVIPSVKAPNIAREIVLRTGLPRKIPGVTVGMACASSNQAITTAADLVFRGYADTVIAGGAEPLSDVPILFSRNCADALVSASKQKSVRGKHDAFRKLNTTASAPAT